MKRESAISLIVLIITIVILVILAAITITNVMNSNLFSLTTGTVKNYINTGEKEQKKLDKFDYEPRNQVYVTLYADGTLTFSRTNIEEGKEVYKTYGNIKYTGFHAEPDAEDNVLWSEDRDKITKVDFLEEIHPRSTSAWFRYCGNLTEINHIENLDTSDVEDMSFMFSNCKNFTELDLSHFNTSKVKSMQSMFAYCTNLKTLNLSNFDTSNVISMRSMFYDCEKLEDLNLSSSFDTKNVTTMKTMFYNCFSLTNLDLSSFDTSNVTSMAYMFEKCFSLTNLDLSSFDTSNVTTMQSMFGNASGLKEIKV